MEQISQYNSTNIDIENRQGIKEKEECIGLMKILGDKAGKVD